MTGRDSKYWNDFSATGHPSQAFQTTYENGRAKKDGIVGRTATNGTNQTWTYNAEGEIVGDGGTTQQYDVTGQLVKTQSNANANVYSTHTHDGDGRQVKFEQKLENVYYSGGYEVVTRYRIFSSVTGKLLTEIDAAGQKIETHVSALDGEYRQMKAYSIKISSTQFTNYPEQIVSEYGDPKGTQAHQWDRQTNTYRNVHMSPAGVANETIKWDQVRDRFVGAIGAQISYAQSQSHYPGTRSQLEDPTNPGTGCELDGKSVSCAKLVRQIVNSGIRKDSIIVHGVVQGPGYGGGRQDDGEGNLTDISLVIANGDINGELVVQSPTMGPTREVKLERGYDLALELLNDTDCANAIKSAKHPRLDPSDLLKHYKSSKQLLTKWDEGFYGSTPEIGREGTITITNNFLQSVNDVGESGLKGQYSWLNAKAAVAFLILHELSHGTGKQTHGSIGSASYDQIMRPSEINEEIWKACFKNNYNFFNKSQKDYTDKMINQGRWKRVGDTIMSGTTTFTVPFA